ncbi:MAG TPA: hypothetical protein VG147_11085 [Solirubrobacteraceae bacterium]|nr:hypothetical protein [Solirubrobacteraceae bacterium]
MTVAVVLAIGAGIWRATASKTNRGLPLLVKADRLVSHAHYMRLFGTMVTGTSRQSFDIVDTPDASLGWVQREGSRIDVERWGDRIFIRLPGRQLPTSSPLFKNGESPWVEVPNRLPEVRGIESLLSLPAVGHLFAPGEIPIQETRVGPELALLTWAVNNTQVYIATGTMEGMPVKVDFGMNASEGSVSFVEINPSNPTPISFPSPVAVA